MPKIPGDTGGLAGATGSMAGLKRKRTEQQHESEDEEDNEKTEGQNPKPRKSRLPCPMWNCRILLGLILQKQVQLYPWKWTLLSRLASSVVTSQAPKAASSDRMAALRRAKDAITKQQHSALPTSPRVLSNKPSLLRQVKSSGAPFIRPILLFHFLPNRAIQLKSTHNRTHIRLVHCLLRLRFLQLW